MKSNDRSVTVPEASDRSVTVSDTNDRPVTAPLPTVTSASSAFSTDVVKILLESRANWC